MLANIDSLGNGWGPQPKIAALWTIGLSLQYLFGHGGCPLLVYKGDYQQYVCVYIYISLSLYIYIWNNIFEGCIKLDMSFQIHLHVLHLSTVILLGLKLNCQCLQWNVRGVQRWACMQFLVF